MVPNNPCAGSRASAVATAMPSTPAIARATSFEKSDGLVAAKDAEIPGSRVVRLDNMDHAGPAMKGVQGVCTPYPPGDVTQALIGLALSS